MSTWEWIFLKRKRIVGRANYDQVDAWLVFVLFFARLLGVWRAFFASKATGVLFLFNRVAEEGRKVQATPSA